MSEEQSGIGGGILKGLKKILFTTEPAQPEVSGSGAATYKPEPITPAPVVKAPTEPALPTDFQEAKAMKLKVYQLLENLNKPGVDFFEVWNAAVEMGGVNSQHIRSAFTSLKFADKGLTREKLMETGRAYMNELNAVIDKESRRRIEEKEHLYKEREQVKASLDREIGALETQVLEINRKISEKKSELAGIHDRYDPRISDIELKITAGRESVQEVLKEMESVILIIDKELNQKI